MALTSKKKLNTLVKENYKGDYGEAVREVRRLEEELQFERAKKMLKENGNQVPFHRWYKNEKFHYEAYGKNKGKVTGYFKSYSVGRGGARRGWIFYRSYETGVIIYVDTEMGKIGMRQGMSYPGNFQSATKKEFDAAYNNFLKMIN